MRASPICSGYWSPDMSGVHPAAHSPPAMARKPAVLLPFVDAPAERVELGVFRKQILPLGDVESDKYGTLRFDRERLRGIVERFKAGAYDMVPLMLADKDNRHHDDPERIRGEVVDVEATDGGLFAKIKAGEAGSRLLTDNPRLPVSVRLVPDEQGEALGHVLATPDPVWRGQHPWELIEAANEREVIDLSDGAFVIPDAGHGRPAGEMADTDAPTITKEDLDFVRSLRERIGDPEEKPEQKPEDRDAERILADLLGDADDADDDADADDADDTADNRDAEPAGVSMSAEDRAKLIELTRRNERTQKQVEKLERDLAKERFQNERDELIRDGVPPVLVELASPALQAPRMEPIELAGGQKVSPQETIRKMLHAAKGMIEFSERGRGVGDGEGDSDRESARELADRMKARFDGEPAKAAS